MTNKAYNYAIYLLSRQDYSVFKITQKLRSKEYTDEEVQAAIDKLIHQNYLREEEYTRSKIKSCLRKGYSNHYIQKKLAQEQIVIESSTIDQLRAEDNISTEVQLSELVDKKLRNKEIPNSFTDRMKLRKKIITYLISRGFSYESAKKALESKIND